MGRRGVEPRVGLHDARPDAAARTGSRSRERRGASCGGPGPRPRDVAGMGLGRHMAGTDFDGNPFFAGEVEPCINGQVAASGAYFGQDVQRIVDRLLGEQLPDGGWNCEADNGSTRSSFNTTICVLEALLEYELAGGSSAEVTGAASARAGVPPRAPPLPPAVDRRGDRARSQGRHRLDALRLPDLVALRRAAGTRVPAPSRRDAGRARGRGDRAGRVEARRRRPVAAREPVPRHDAGRDGRGRGPAEPVEHAARLTGVGLVCGARRAARRAQMPPRQGPAGCQSYILLRGNSPLPARFRRSRHRPVPRSFTTGSLRPCHSPPRSPSAAPAPSFGWRIPGCSPRRKPSVTAASASRPARPAARAARRWSARP